MNNVATTTVTIVGSGAAGLTAGYRLKRQGIPVQILEAASIRLGRAKKLEGFADFPIDIGGEWIHVPPSILDTILDDPNITNDPKQYVQPYDIGNTSFWTGEDDPVWYEVPFPNEDHIWVNFTWFDFFDQYIAPTVEDDIVYDCQVDSIDYRDAASITTTCKDGSSFSSEYVIVTVPISILADKDITFTPELPESHTNAIDLLPIAPGLKVFIEFTEPFYRVGFGLESDAPVFFDCGARFFWDEAFRQGSQDNILGVFSVADVFEVHYTNKTDQEVFDGIMADLDEWYGGNATATYVKHVVQNWVNEPYVRGAYLECPKDISAMSTLQEPIGDGRIFFAGEAIPIDGESHGFMHGAALSGASAAERIMGENQPSAAASAGVGLSFPLVLAFLHFFL